MAAKILSVRQLVNKKFKELEGLPAWMIACFGDVDNACKAFFYGSSNHGKSSMVLSFLAGLLGSGKNGRALYWSLEEGHRQSIQKAVGRYLDPEKYSGLISFASRELTPDDLRAKLRKRGSEKIIVVDSVQYACKIFKMDYAQFTSIMDAFPDKIWIYVSHGSGLDKPRGAVAEDLLYDADIKCYIEGKIAFIGSRIGGNKNHVIWEEGAKRYWKEKFWEKAEIEKPKKTKSKKRNEESSVNESAV